MIIIEVMWLLRGYKEWQKFGFDFKLIFFKKILITYYISVTLKLLEFMLSTCAEKRKKIKKIKKRKSR